MPAFKSSAFEPKTLHDFNPCAEVIGLDSTIHHGGRNSLKDRDVHELTAETSLGKRSLCALRTSPYTGRAMPKNGRARVLPLLFVLTVTSVVQASIAPTCHQATLWEAL